MTRNHKVGTILTFISGVGIGATVALLFAPKAGEELRAAIAEGVSEGGNQVRSAGKELKQRAQKVVSLAKDHVEDAIEAGDKAYSQANKA
jgi:gas vesicle protein